MISSYQDGKIGVMPDFKINPEVYNSALEQCRFDRAMDEIWEHVRGLNQYIEKQQPWVVAKTDAKKLQQILAHQVAVLLQIAELLKPMLPATADKIVSVFGSGTIKPLSGTLFPKNG
jgi:methionyl-tRNA synthetase